MDRNKEKKVIVSLNPNGEHLSREKTPEEKLLWGLRANGMTGTDEEIMALVRLYETLNGTPYGAGLSLLNKKQ